MVAGSHQCRSRHGHAAQRSGSSAEKLGAAAWESADCATAASEGQESDGVDSPYDTGRYDHPSTGCMQRIDVCIHATGRPSLCLGSSGRSRDLCCPTGEIGGREPAYVTAHVHQPTRASRPATAGSGDLGGASRYQDDAPLRAPGTRSFARRDRLIRGAWNPPQKLSTTKRVTLTK